VQVWLERIRGLYLECCDPFLHLPLTLSSKYPICSLVPWAFCVQGELEGLLALTCRGAEKVIGWGAVTPYPKAQVLGWTEWRHWDRHLRTKHRCIHTLYKLTSFPIKMAGVCSAQVPPLMFPPDFLGTGIEIMYHSINLPPNKNGWYVLCSGSTINASSRFPWHGDWDYASLPIKNGWYVLCSEVPPLMLPPDFLGTGIEIMRLCVSFNRDWRPSGQDYQISCPRFLLISSDGIGNLAP
jgi:hypothetical protein